jgi:hypothetical protein
LKVFREILVNRNLVFGLAWLGANLPLFIRASFYLHCDAGSRAEFLACAFQIVRVKLTLK